MGRPPGLIGGDWNSISADRVFRAGWVSEDDAEPDRWVLYDPDPYTGPDRQWHGDLVYQTRWETDARGVRRWWADREPGEVLYAGGLRDVAAELKAPWQTTVGHCGDDPYGERRIDAIRVTEEVVPALRGYEVVNNEMTRAASDFSEHGQKPRTVDPKKASDHLPVVVTYDPDLIDFSLAR